MIHGVEAVARVKFFFLFHNTKTRGHPMKQLSCQFRTDKRRRYFIQSTFNLWNSPPQVGLMTASTGRLASCSGGELVCQWPLGIRQLGGSSMSGGSVSLNASCWGGEAPLPLGPVSESSQEHLDGHCIISDAGLDGPAWV